VENDTQLQSLWWLKTPRRLKKPTAAKADVDDIL